MGKDLVMIRNSVTQTTTACFEPALDYVVAKMPRLDLLDKLIIFRLISIYSNYFYCIVHRLYFFEQMGPEKISEGVRFPWVIDEKCWRGKLSFKYVSLCPAKFFIQNHLV